jgi:hypothetical protein
MEHAAGSSRTHPTCVVSASMPVAQFAERASPNTTLLSVLLGECMMRCDAECVRTLSTYVLPQNAATHKHRSVSYNVSRARVYRRTCRCNEVSSKIYIQHVHMPDMYPQDCSTPRSLFRK